MFISLSPSFPSFLPSPSLMCCVILPTLFTGKGSYFRRGIVTQLSSDDLLAEVFWGFCEVNIRRSVLRQGFTSLGNSDDCCDIRGKWPLTRKGNRTVAGWHHHISIKFFWPLSVVPCKKNTLLLSFTSHHSIPIFLWPKSRLNIVLSNTFSLDSSLKVRDVSHSYIN